ncbi:hypothetical protein KKH27_08240 [bacterium]|nr:hypothetical protein [bacterium]MBU1983865.1 hypothetical protein [bacterium]
MTPSRGIGSLFVVLVLFATTESPAQVVRPQFSRKITISDSVFIHDFIQQQALPIGERVDSLEFLDLDARGFSENDFVVVYPTRETFPLVEIGEQTRAYMEQWQTANPWQVTAPRMSSSQLFEMAGRPEVRSALMGMLGFVLRGLEVFYEGTNVEGRFRQDSNTVYIELWNFDPALFQYRDLEGTGMSDTITSYDLLQVVRDDTLFLTDSTLFDVIYVYKTFRDTVFIPQVGKSPSENDDR